MSFWEKLTVGLVGTVVLIGVYELFVQELKILWTKRKLKK